MIDWKIRALKAEAELQMIEKTEPVAWINLAASSKMFRFLAPTEEDGTVVKDWQPLFTHPMPAQDAEAGMIKLPEPEITLAWCSWTEKWEARELKHCLAREEGDRVIGYTEAQLKQAVRDALDTQDVEDAARYRWLRDYLISPSTHFDDLIVSADKADTLDGVIDAARAKGAKQ